MGWRKGKTSGDLKIFSNKLYISKKVYLAHINKWLWFFSILSGPLKTWPLFRLCFQYKDTFYIYTYFIKNITCAINSVYQNESQKKNLKNYYIECFDSTPCVFGCYIMLDITFSKLEKLHIRFLLIIIIL